MKIESLKQSVHSDLWTILPKAHYALKAAIDSKADIDFDLPKYPTADSSQTTDGDTIVIEVYGTIVKGVDPILCQYFGLCDIDGIAEQVRSASLDDSISTSIFDFKSPGGMTLGVYEVSEMIRSLGKTKRTIAYSSGVMASAAYWLGCACNEVYVSPSSIVGSVGVSCIRYDSTEANKQAGVDVQFFATSPRKFWGNPGYPVSDDEKEYIQASIERTAEMFYASVKENRNIDQELLNTASVVDGIEAVETGFADGIYNTRYDLMEEI